MPTNANDVVLTTFTYTNGALGSYYQFSTSLLDAGSRYSANAGLYLFTTTVDETSEGESIVNIGLHYPCADTNGSALDTDGDGLYDVEEDKNGNGVRDADETDLAMADTDGDGLTDYEELRIIGLPYTNPLLADTDGNGIPDGEEDFDNDGITTLGEMRWAAASPIDAFSLNRALNGNSSTMDGSFRCVAGQLTNSLVIMTISNMTNFLRISLIGATPPFIYDVYAKLIGSPYSLYQRGALNQSSIDVPNPPSGTIFRAGSGFDRDGDGLTDGYECLITGTIIDFWDTDRDGIADGWKCSTASTRRTG